MNNGLSIWKCRGCGSTYFPERFVCHVCGKAEFDKIIASAGRAEEITIVSHVIGQEAWKPRPIVTVRLEEGPRILAGGLDDLEEGDEVDVFHEDAVPYVRRRGRAT